MRPPWIADIRQRATAIQQTQKAAGNFNQLFMKGFRPNWPWITALGASHIAFGGISPRSNLQKPYRLKFPHFHDRIREWILSRYHFMLWFAVFWAWLDRGLARRQSGF
ncbi:hypothetical protein Q4577_09285 [Marinovum sp. 2_MG-2023]|uniref:hypothetical protein n=1 Tax=unclassified Marinovum TaxID=2647166 RepID=UPI0026E235EE|nr:MULTISPECIES: hypothetical protein [unclassified Marinovum]MDO6730211.1 hypothetical protein [Marinovum sp. 2_MG-2023]MDO6778949.1 hypothetical protein [Marinovum sp. 1_MG-2023]